MEGNRPARNRYTQEQLAFLRKGYMSMNVRNLTAAFNDRFGAGRTEAAVKTTLHRHNIRCGRKHRERLVERLRRLFTEEQERFVRRHYKIHSLAELTVLFNSHFGTDRTEAQVRSFTRNHEIRSGRTGRFEKNHKPWNDGTKGQGLTGPNRCSFKKGQVPANIRPLGSERICSKDGFVLVKVAETNPYTGSPTRYKHKHVHVWEQNNGPVPEGMVVAFRDGDRRNCDPGNLMLITRAELLNLNRNRYRAVPGDLKPSVLALSKLQVQTWAMEKEAR